MTISIRCQNISSINQLILNVQILYLSLFPVHLFLIFKCKSCLFYDLFNDSLQKVAISFMKIIIMKNKTEFCKYKVSQNKVKLKLSFETPRVLKFPSNHCQMSITFIEINLYFK